MQDTLGADWIPPKEVIIVDGYGVILSGAILLMQGLCVALLRFVFHLPLDISLLIVILVVQAFVSGPTLIATD